MGKPRQESPLGTPRQSLMRKGRSALSVLTQPTRLHCARREQAAPSDATASGAGREGNRRDWGRRASGHNWPRARRIFAPRLGLAAWPRAECCGKLL